MFPSSNNVHRSFSARLTLIAVSFLLISLFLVACGGSAASVQVKPTHKPAPKVTPTYLIQSGVLMVGNYTNYPPQEYIDPRTQNPTGFDIDLIQAIAKRLNLKLQIVNLDFRSLIPSLKAKAVDIAISAIPITPDLSGQVNFVPYFNGGESLMVLKGNPHAIAKVSDLCGLSVAARSNTIEATDLQTASNDCKNNGKKPIDIHILDSQDAVVQLLLTKRVVATYQDSPVTDYAARQQAGLVEAVMPIINANPEGIAVRIQDTALFAAIQATFNKMKSDHTYHNLILKWGLVNEEL